MHRRSPGQTVLAHGNSTDWSSGAIKKIHGGNWIWQNCAKRRPSNHSADQSLDKWNHDLVSTTNVDRIFVFLPTFFFLLSRSFSSRFVIICIKLIRIFVVYRVPVSPFRDLIVCKRTRRFVFASRNTYCIMEKMKNVKGVGKIISNLEENVDIFLYFGLRLHMIDV